MKIFPNEIRDGQIFEADVCIVGSGPAGISLALELEATGKKIIILAGGIHKETSVNRELNKGIVNPKGSHEPLEENRRRSYGGASTVWGGRCIPLDPIDFKKRSWVEHSGWPFDYDVMKPYYQKANEICKAGKFSYNAQQVFPGHQKEIIPGLDNEEISSSPLERWSTPVDFGKDFEDVLNGSSNIVVLMDSHLLEIRCESKKDSVSSLYCIANKNFYVKSKNYVLACGAIENPRLLLVSQNSFHPNGIGNDNDVVGRYYMSHLNGTFAVVSPNYRKKILYNFERDQEGVYSRRRWWITEVAQKNNEIGNGILFLHRSQNTDGHRDPLFSAVYLSKFFISLIKNRSVATGKRMWFENKQELFSHSSIVFKQGWKNLPSLVSVAFKRFQKRRLPFVLPPINSKNLGIYFQTEQAPNPKSRITVSETEKDHLGMPKAVVEIAFTELDRKTVKEIHRIFFKRYNISLGEKIELNFHNLESYTESRLSKFNSAAHQLGTTRISQDPNRGVVDENCQVHGVKNLYIAGSSVFPTGGHVNPTLTIVALSVKLAEFLKKKIQ